MSVWVPNQQHYIINVTAKSKKTMKDKFNLFLISICRDLQQNKLVFFILNKEPLNTQNIIYSIKDHKVALLLQIQTKYESLYC